MTPTTRRALAQFIEPTAILPSTTRDQIHRMCDECVAHGLVAACVRHEWVAESVARLRGGFTRVCAVLGTPPDDADTIVQSLAARSAAEAGAAEIEFPLDHAALVAGDKRAVLTALSAVTAAAKCVNSDVLVKVSLDTGCLTPDQIILGCRCVAEAQADFIVAGAGLDALSAATVQHVAMLRKHIAPIGVKAAGANGDRRAVLSLIAAGASRVGLVAGAAVMRDWPE